MPARKAPAELLASSVKVHVSADGERLLRRAATQCGAHLSAWIREVATREAAWQTARHKGKAWKG